MLNHKPLISIIIPCRNEENYINNILANICEQAGTNIDFNIEVLVIEGNSSDKTLSIINEFIKDKSNFKIIINEKQITPIAFNLGIKQAKGDYICILGSHAEIDKDYLLSCLKTIQKTDADNVGGPWIAQNTSYIGKVIAVGFQNPVSVGGARSHDVNHEGYVDSVWGGFYKKEVFAKIGLFDEELIRNQDDEFNFRLIKSGGKIWQSPSIKYNYISRDNLVKLFKQYYQYGYWKIRVIDKHKLPASIRHIIPAIFVASLILLIPLSVISKMFSILLLLELASYALVILIASICSCFRMLKYLPILPIVIMIFHFSYGLGFLKGILDFMVFKKHQKNIIIDQKLSR